MRVCAATLPGSESSPNEDWLHASSHVAIVLDGLTARTETGCRHSVEWYVEQLGGALAQRVTDADATLSEILGESISWVAGQHQECDLENPSTPAAAVGIVRVRPSDGAGNLEYLALGDVTVVLEKETGDVQIVQDERINRTAVSERVAADRFLIGSDEKSAALLAMKRAEISARNVPGGYWIAAASPDAARHAVAGAVSGRDFHRGLLLTDGAARLVTMFAVEDWRGLLDMTERAGPCAVLRDLRRAEAGDPVGARWPRNKASDDATLVLFSTDIQGGLTSRVTTSLRSDVILER
jgi:hypothetical protein